MRFYAMDNLREKNALEYAKQEFNRGTLDVYWLKRLYNELAEKLNYHIEFWVDWCEYGWDEEIYCFIHVNWIGSIVFNWWVRQYTDTKWLIDYLYSLEQDAKEIQNNILNYNKK